MSREETGVLKPSMVVNLFSSQVTTEVKSIETPHDTLSEPLPGDSVGFSVKNVSVKDVHCDSVAGDSKNDLPVDAGDFMAQVIVMNHPGKISAGFSHSSHCLQVC